MKTVCRSLLVGGGACLIQLHALAGSPGRVAAWNVASGRSASGGTPISQDRIERLGEVIAHQIKPDLIVLEEVWPESAAAGIARAATKNGFALVAVPLPPQGSEVVQLISILKRPTVEVTEAKLIESSDDLVEGDDPEEKTTRKAVLARARMDHFDFYLVGVHLKSKRASGTALVSPLEMRDRQCNVIADCLHDLTAQGAEKDVLLVGDYNMTPAGQAEAGESSDEKNFATLDRHHELRFISSEDKAPTHLGFFNGGFHRSKLDGFAIAHATEKEYVTGSFHSLDNKLLGVDEKQFTDRRSPNYLSDHFPIVAEFKTNEDDD